MSPLGVEEVCDFDFAVAYDDHFLTQTFSDRQVIHLTFDDVYTNNQTGFSFVDQANYSIRFDFASGLAQHDGAFWHITVPGSGHGILIQDTGRFLQNWYLAPPWVPFALQGHHDINATWPNTPYRYCEFMKDNFQPLP